MQKPRLSMKERERRHDRFIVWCHRAVMAYMVVSLAVFTGLFFLGRVGQVELALDIMFYAVWAAFAVGVLGIAIVLVRMCRTP